MTLHRVVWVGVVVAVFAGVPREASALDLVFDGGVDAAVPTGIAPTFVGATVAVSPMWRLAPSHGLGLTLRGSLMTPVAWPDDDDTGVPLARSGSSHPSAQLLATYRLVVAERAKWGAQFGLGVGFGIWPSCVRGDLCGGGGLASSVQAALRSRLAEGSVMLLGLELATQSGMGNKVDTFLMPRAFLGISSSL